MHSPVHSLRGTLASILAATLFGLPSASADVTVSSAPVGYYRIPLTEGFQTVGVTLVNNPALVSLVDSTDTDIVAITEDGVIVGDLLDENTSYYIEIVEGPTGVQDLYVGHRLEVDTGATIDDADEGEIIIDPADEYTTLDLAPASGPTPDLSGYRMELREHMTVSQAFDKNLLHASTSLSSADQIQHFDGTKFVVYYLLRNSDDTARAWVKSDLATVADDEIIAPGVGLLYKRSASATGSAQLVISGKVRTNPFYQSLKQGFNFAAEPYPITANFVEREALAPTFVADPSASQADQVQIFDGSKFVVYHLLSNSDGSLTAWVLTSNPVAIEDENPIFDYRSSVFFKMKQGAEGYRVPLTWTP